jgi:hypothetical protein
VLTVKVKPYACNKDQSTVHQFDSTIFLQSDGTRNSPDITTIIMGLNSDEWNETVGAYLALDLLSNRIVLCGKETLSRARSYKIAEAKAPLGGVN